MSMLRAGGIELLTDGVRGPDVDNPLGYFELEPVKSLAKDASWLDAERGKAIKVISALLQHLPRTHRYKVLFMRRDLDEVLASQARMLEHHGQPYDAEGDRLLRAELAAHHTSTAHLQGHEPAFDAHHLRFAGIQHTPSAEIAGIASFLGIAVDSAAVRACIDPTLCRSRGASKVPEAP